MIISLRRKDVACILFQGRKLETLRPPVQTEPARDGECKVRSLGPVSSLASLGAIPEPVGKLPANPLSLFVSPHDGWFRLGLRAPTAARQRPLGNELNPGPIMPPATSTGF